MDKFDRGFIAFMIIAIFILLLVFNVRITSLEDKVKKLEQINEVKEIVSRGHDTGMSIGGSIFTKSTIYIDIPISHTHTSDPLPFPRNSVRLFSR